MEIAQEAEQQFGRKFVVRVSSERRNSEIDPEWADRLIETAQQALALLTTGDTGDD